jgi:hypothetical protein
MNMAHTPGGKAPLILLTVSAKTAAGGIYHALHRGDRLRYLIELVQ